MSPAPTDFAVVLYARVSRVRDERHKSVDDQLRELRAWAAREGWPVHDEHRDDDISASRFARSKERDGWQATMDDLASRRVRALLAWESSRTTRDKKVFAALEETCRQHRVLYGFSGQLYDLSTSDGEFQAGLRNLLDVQESAKISERVQRAVNSRAADGRPHGPLQYGYRRIIHQRTGAVLGREEDPEAAPVVREVVARFLAREHGEAIARDLNERGIPGAHGGRWTSTTVSKLARNPAYAGLRVHHGQVVPDVVGDWPGLISMDDHNRILAMFADPDRDKFRRTTRTKHLGTGLFRCGVDGCDGRMRALITSARANRYGCRTCQGVSRAQEPVDKWVGDHVVARLAAPDVFAALTEPTAGKKPSDAAAEAARLRADMADARSMLESGDLTLPDFAAFRKGWEPRMERAESAARPRTIPPALLDMAGPEARRLWDEADAKDRRTVVDTLMIVTILPRGKAAPRRGGFDEDSVHIEWRTR